MSVVGTVVISFTSVDAVDLLLDIWAVAHKVVTNVTLQGAAAELPAPGGTGCIGRYDSLAPCTARKLF